MGVDYMSVVLYGTTDSEIFSNFPEKMQKLFNGGWVDQDEDLSEYFDGEDLEESAQEYLSKELYEDFKNFSFYANGYCASAEDGFEGFGVRINLNQLRDGGIDSFLNNKVNEIFEKYKLGKPELVQFVHMY